MAAKLRIGFVLFPGITQLDFTGPYEVVARVPELDVVTVAKTMEPVRSEFGLSFLPDVDFGSAPQLDILCVPGGSGIVAAASDAETIGFLQTRAASARYLTSVCTGSLLLGAAGLLKGYHATTHWLSLDLLKLVGAIPVRERIVKDRNRITGGGITSGMDFGFALAAEVAGRETAERVQLVMEYDPAPPFNSGNPETADRSLVETVTEERAALQAERRKFFEGLSLSLDARG